MGHMKSPNTVIYRGRIKRKDRERLNGCRSAALWFTGLSGSGKSTIAHRVEEKLHEMGILTYVFDGDNVRHGLCADLSFAPEARYENIRRISEMVKLFLDAGVFCLTAFISPMIADRQRVRSKLGKGDFVEIFVDCPLDVCEARDVKGLYKLARAGKIKNYTGVSAPYEVPDNPEIVLKTNQYSLDECVDQVISYIQDHIVEHPGG
jgi:adenylylsulfate kinase